MVSLILLKYLMEGYLAYEKKCLELLEYRGIGFYPYIKDIELILQVVKKNFENNFNITDINV